MKPGIVTTNKARDNGGMDRRRRKIFMRWIAFAAVLAAFAAVELIVQSAGRQADRASAQYRARSMELWRKLQGYSSRDLARLEREINDGQPLAREEISGPPGRFTRIWVEGYRVDPRYSGWTAQLDLGPGWTMVGVSGPEHRPPGSWLGSRAARGWAEALQRVVLIAATVVCWSGLWIIPIAMASRRQAGRICAAAGLMMLIAWALNPRMVWSWPPQLDWMIVTSVVALGVAIVAAAIPAGRRAVPGFCYHCGYNLTGNLSGTCPECGASTPSRAGQMRSSGPSVV